MPNKDELLWPGTLVTAEMTLRSEEARGRAFERGAGQPDRQLSFSSSRTASRRFSTSTVERQVGRETVIASGLNGGETVVTDGQLLLSDGTRVNPRPAKAAGN